MSCIIVLVKYTKIKEEGDDLGYYQEVETDIREHIIKDAHWVDNDPEKTVNDWVSGLFDCYAENPTTEIEVLVAYVKYDNHLNDKVITPFRRRMV